MIVPGRIVVLLVVAFHCQAACASDGPAAWWSFDQINNSNTADKVTLVEDGIGGNFEQAPGVIGTALKFDGFTTEIIRAAKSAPRLGNAFTIEAWVALGAYPWNWCPVISQSREPQAGYNFAVGPRGQLALQIAVGGKWIACTSADFVLPLRKWAHVAGTFQQGKNLAIYVNGEESGSVQADGEFTCADAADLRIGVIPAPVKPSNIHREFGTLPAWFSLDGILDELKVYNRALSPAEVRGAFAAAGSLPEPDLPLRKMPSGPTGPGRFGAYYTRLKYYAAWDALWRVGPDADVLVRFDESPVRVVFWRGTRYSPAWVSENEQWMADQSVEAWNGVEGCFEHMQDPHCLYSHVRIIENTDARVVIHWRYAPVSAHNKLWRVNPKTGFACWVDEYYTIYPDAAGVRKVTWQAGTLGGPRQFQESLPFTQPGQYSSNVVERTFCTVANLKGESAGISFVAKPAKGRADLPSNLTMQIYNFKAQNKPFIIFENGSRMTYLNDLDENNLARPGNCNHWPAGQLPCDGRTSQAPDQPSHFLGFPISYPPVHTNKNREWWNGLYGMTTNSIVELAKLARSWTQAPELALKGQGYSNEGFDRGDRAYHLRNNAANGAGALEFQILASADSPLVNLALAVENWGQAGANLLIDGKPVPRGSRFRYGYRHELDGSTLLVWIKLETTTSVTIKLTLEK